MQIWIYSPRLTASAELGNCPDVLLLQCLLLLPAGFLTAILEDMGFSFINAQGLSAPPYFLAFLAVLLSTWIADRTSQRGYTTLLLSLLGQQATSYLLFR